MALQAWQQAIGMLVAQESSPGARRTPLDQGGLSDAEQQWLAHVTGTPGFRVTCTVQRWWRDLRLRTAAPLTLAAVGDDCAEALLQRYLDTHLATTQFFLAEAIRFLDWLQRTGEIEAFPHASSVAAWEGARLRALLAGRGAGRPAQDLVQTARAVALVPFSSPPEHVFTALLTGRPLPAAGAEFWDVLVVPGTPPRWRVVEPEEALLVTICGTPRSLDALRAAGASDACLSRLVAEGALESPGSRLLGGDEGLQP
jgi:hypothetical protein